MIVLPSIAWADQARPIRDVYVVVFVLDGLNQKTLANALGTSDIPNIRKYFLEEGKYFDNVQTVFPSASNVAYQAMVSGKEPGDVGLTYLGRYDRKKMKPINYFSIKGQKEMVEDFHGHTLFDDLKGYETAAIYSSFGRGATFSRPKIPIPAIWSTFASQREEMLDKYAMSEVMDLFARPMALLPRFTLTGLYGFDTIGHHYGASSVLLKYDLEQFDLLLGRLIDLLKERGIFDKTYIVLLSDHGMHDTPKGFFDLKKFISDSGLKIYNGRSKKGDWDVVPIVRGIASAEIYITRNKGVDLVSLLRSRDEIQYVIVKDHIYTKDGEVKPIGYLKEVNQVFNDPTVGDIFVVAKDDYVFYREKAATHGGLSEDDMRTFMFLRGPDVARSKINIKKITELYPVMKKWF